MSKPLKGMDLAVRIVFLVLLGLLILGGLGYLVLLLYVPISGWLIWRLTDRTSSLEARVAVLEGHPVEKKEK